ncbi:NAD-dependent epimerase/dehydratase family protein [Salinibacillus xinjiangensis]|uniref:NAD-dependent epimerase/dehydratase family protein n=1 Tax=Salinibacillus xinjiangensis TaxID=1229268 RepID=A0A6G1X217_9BACI|nr:NAD-dependent epimerase/dehydratase family protein [Salinibacillus xinjiangensis]MRG85031.1 NAD-dependent epimerase/dehydratase family protein [Salinibacillus xinjiangensis]
MLKKVLVTGGCGFIGSHTVDKLLNQGHEVIVVDNLSNGELTNIDYERVNYFYCDVGGRSFEQVVYATRPEYIIHLAEQVTYPQLPETMEEDCNANISNSVNVIKVAKKFGVQKVLFASSMDVYSKNQNSEKLGPSGLAKLTGELYLQFAGELDGLDYTILRFSEVYGQRDLRGTVSHSLDQTNKDLTLDHRGNHEFVYVEDVVDATLETLDKRSQQTVCWR